MFTKLNQKYDQIPNHNHRFLILLGLLSPALILMGVEAITGNPAFWLLGMAHCLILLAIRINYIEGSKKERRNGK